MKKFKKLAPLLLSVLMFMALLAGCAGGASSSKEEESSGSSSQSSEETSAGESSSGEEVQDEKYPGETVKIGFVTYDTTADLFLEIQRYYEYLSEFFNIEMMYSESISSPEDEMTFIENCAAAGCDAIIGYYNEARNESVQLAIDKGMYFYGVAEEDDVYNAFKDNELYLGGYYNENMDYQSGYTVGKGLIDAGCKKLAYTSGGRDFGVKMFIDRSEGFYAAVEEAQAEGIDVEVVYDVSGWPGTDAFSSEQSAALDTDVDGIGGSFGIGIWLQPVSNSGKDIKLASVDALSEIFFDFWDNGMIAAFSVENADIFGMAIPLIINAADGNLVRDENGFAPRVPVDRLAITSAEDFHSYYEIESNGTWIVNIADMKTVITGLNPDFNYKDLGELYTANTLEDVSARRGS